MAGFNWDRARRLDAVRRGSDKLPELGDNSSPDKYRINRERLKTSDFPI